MNAILCRMIRVWAIPVLLAAAAALGAHQYMREVNADDAGRQSSMVPARFAALNVELPSGSVTFPDGDGSDIASANCLICHSAGMIMRQPPLTVSEWRTEIEKMRTSFGAPIPSDQINPLAEYLATINGRPSDGQPATVDRQGN